MKTSPLFQTGGIRRSLILAGGGVRLAYHAGVLKALEEASVSFQHVDGTSGGIFNTAMLASDLNPEEICQRWRKLNVMGFMSPTPIRNYLKITRMTAMGDADGIREKVFPTLGIDLNKINQNNRFEATFNVCNFSAKTVESIDGSVVQEDHLIAGMSLPVFMPALQIGADWYTDAVWIKDANLMEAVKRGAEEIFVVYCIGNSKAYFDGSFVQYVHMIEMSAAGGLLAELDWIAQVNHQILNGLSPYGQSSPIKIQIIKPAFPLPLDPDLFLGSINIRSLINMGYAETKSALKTLPEAGVAYDYKAILMQEPGTSFQFMTQFEGVLSIGGMKTKATFHALFDLRETAESGFGPLFFGSFEWPGAEVSTCQNIVEFSNENGVRKCHISGTFLKTDTEHHFTGELRLGSPTEFMLGLEFKSMALQIDETEIVLFHQSIANRLRMVFKSKLYLYGGLMKRWKVKKNILSLMFGK